MKSKFNIMLMGLFFAISFLFVNTANAQAPIKKPQRTTTQQAKPSQKPQNNSVQPEVKSFNWDNNGICTDQIVDLGLSVKWAGWSVGANTTYQDGVLYGWGDPTGTKTSIYSSDYPIQDPPLSICGDRRYDIAMVNWGWPWRMPTKKNFEELVNKCKKENIVLNGKKGTKFTGPNGNTLFLPHTKVRSPHWNKEKGGYDYMDTYFNSNYGQYYSGELNSNGGQWPAWDSRPFVLCICMSDYSPCYIGGEGLRCEGHPVRAVYDR